MAGELTLILGPMKSGKSLELISFFSPMAHSDLKHGLYQSVRNTRDEHLTSRTGLNLAAKKVKNLEEIRETDEVLVGIDELHFLEPKDMQVINHLLARGTDVIMAGLDTDYRGLMFDTVRAAFELVPTKVIYEKSVCDVCHKYQAIFTQVLRGNRPITEGIPPSVADDGTYQYEARCRTCFVRA